MIAILSKIGLKHHILPVINLQTMISKTEFSNMKLDMALNELSLKDLWLLYVQIYQIWRWQSKIQTQTNIFLQQ